jgi:Outer membrane protein and related peptidoglycan-associated (lipo)proteins
MLRVLAVLPFLLPGASPQPAVPDEAIRSSIVDLQLPIQDLGVSESVRDLTLPIEELEVETRDGDRTSVSISSDVLFAFDKADLTAAARRRIAAVAERIKDAEGVVVIEGHTDALGSEAYNLRLSRRRADAVKRELARVLPGVRARAVGYGESRPVAPNTKDGKDHPEGRAKNRRVTITFKEG